VSFDLSHPEVLDAVRRALAEDIGSGDITTELCVPADTRARGRFVARRPMTLAGVELLPLIVGMPPACDLQLFQRSGAQLCAGDEIAAVSGPARTLLTAERTALNFLQRLSGVATLAHAYASAVQGTGCRVLDTRKTTPGLRQLEKMAAAAGGVTNHRAGLYDAVLIKNNHIEAAGGVRAALERARTAPAEMKVEIEVRTRAELEEALACGAQHLLLDNLTPAEAREWIAHIARRATVELSGGITLATARAYAETGADFLSSGAITHSAPAVDINFRLELER
jgi:nicotinate-nucleotide pyrophosphorylase (carboxylating)